MLRLAKMNQSYYFGQGALKTLHSTLDKRRSLNPGHTHCIYLVDHFFKASLKPEDLGWVEGDAWVWIATEDEPTTEGIDYLMLTLKEGGFLQRLPAAVIGMGGGITMDTAKAISNLLTNPGSASDYQGWDLLKNPGVYKIGIPTLSGTGAESSRTCVLTNKTKNIKLGMNSEHSVFDHLIMDPELTATVESNQYFYTAMDAYIHCVESLSGSHRDLLADLYSQNSVELCREIFNAKDMKGPSQREKLMAASFFGGIAIANTYVGVVHPLSAGLSTVLGLHHCVANCIVMNVMEEYYPEATREFQVFMDKQNVKIPLKVTSMLNDEGFDKLYASMIVHEKPLTNALGKDFKSVLTPAKVKSLYLRM